MYCECIGQSHKCASTLNVERIEDGVKIELKDQWLKPDGSTDYDHLHYSHVLLGPTSIVRLIRELRKTLLALTMEPSDD